MHCDLNQKFAGKNGVVYGFYKLLNVYIKKPGFVHILHILPYCATMFLGVNYVEKKTQINILLEKIRLLYRCYIGAI